MARQKKKAADRSESVKPRRAHRKSRNGCTVCKQRHMKCDESRPICLNCKISNRQCAYAASDLSPSPQETSPDTQTSPASCDPAYGTPNSDTPGLVPPTLLSAITPTTYNATLERGDLFTLDHLALLHHIETSIPDMMLGDSFGHTLVNDIMEYALTCPYLMNQVLAIGALHLSKSDTTQVRHLQQATALQTRAVALFNEARDEISEETCVPMFLFSSLLGVHVLCDTLQGPREHLGAVLDRFVRYLSIQRGVRAVTGQSWSMIKRSGIGDFLQRIEDAIPPGGHSTRETEPLSRMIDESGLGSASVHAYRETISMLQQAFSIHHSLRLRGRRFDAALMFCATLNEEYIDLLSQRQPEALVILAFYAVLLHWNRDVWVLGDGGEYLIKAIAAHLGAHWASWLHWPVSVLENSSGLDT
ncbi:uncharacterized protein NECHADRAFT_45340 [Fusarium vanettenii 77-13-4]|uniref:Zn(2)-C6 fungal-type domain-containing protein n=1 Tax=Fusarium vanettenii (strain ATCC MYA-4622 / CBS 123669 / FGSC 9596 / NRRL 45880 / 77-13-4) TaxID=660122 RepID=C7YXD7_FUSV7|nr:uncharacterized protein NECHADRAFT_45340 [Fusarium vanettenii 77-13-4]EEU43320.1 hypothetical protein NECHADRAFT_45340 [Fusarium vanettenii 77-13-4]